jgi:hypothetical protein
MQAGSSGAIGSTDFSGTSSKNQSKHNHAHRAAKRQSATAASKASAEFQRARALQLEADLTSAVELETSAEQRADQLRVELLAARAENERLQTFLLSQTATIDDYSAELERCRTADRRRQEQSRNLTERVVCLEGALAEAADIAAEAVELAEDLDRRLQKIDNLALAHDQQYYDTFYDDPSGTSSPRQPSAEPCPGGCVSGFSPSPPPSWGRA